VQELSILLPGMSAQRLLQLDRNLLAQLASDTPGVRRVQCLKCSSLQPMQFGQINTRERRAGVARRLISLQDLFPTANVSKLVSKRYATISASMRLPSAWHAQQAHLHPLTQTTACRPGLLLESIFRHVPTARAELADLFPQADIDLMVQVQSCDHTGCISRPCRMSGMV
jgi:hypothetical protein